jgi:hypothetical protein
MIAFTHDVPATDGAEGRQGPGGARIIRHAACRGPAAVLLTIRILAINHLVAKRKPVATSVRLSAVSGVRNGRGERAGKCPRQLPEAGFPCRAVRAFPAQTQRRNMTHICVIM